MKASEKTDLFNEADELKEASPILYAEAAELEDPVTYAAEAIVTAEACANLREA